ncbi:alpha-hydroxy-acid oxidizing protein [Micromonospora sp. PSH03]|uniref:glutamate synthase-related protein n=1 Tax=Micromonospora salmantinae TaxID=2911211 RepID=UPI001EE9A0BD|nr:glutamate synthase-related protein [Micromonospora salmantinae]MCG5454693.1 alpha-hydroxy-acid oxidizing protein [Micromonospora salmantinae]
MSDLLRAPGFPEEEVRARARDGERTVFPAADSYGTTLYGAGAPVPADGLDALRVAPPLFMPGRLGELVQLGREPLFSDVDLDTDIGGFRSPVPVFVCAFGSTRVANDGLAAAASRQAARLGLPMLVGENIAPVHGYRDEAELAGTLIKRIRLYLDEVPDGMGGVVVQQSTEDADAEVWNHLYSDPTVEPLLKTGRLGFELKVGQGAKPGLGGMTLVDRADGSRLAEQFRLSTLNGVADDDRNASFVRSSSPGTFTADILRHQIRLMRNNYPRCRTWVKLFPGRDVAEAVAVAHAAGADAVTVDGAEGGTGWAPTSFLHHVGLPLGECLVRLSDTPACLLASGRMWEGARAAKAIALGARAVGLGRAALLAVDEDADQGLLRLVRCLALELQMLTSAVGKYRVGLLSPDDLWRPDVPT